MMAEINSRSKTGLKIIACMLAGCLAIACAVLAVGGTASAYADTGAATGKIAAASDDANDTAAITTKTTKKGGAVRTIKITCTGTPAGTVSYTLYSKGKTFKGKDGKVVGDAKKPAYALKVSLGGDLAADYNVYYRAYAKGYGWLGWAANGAKAGTANMNMTKCEVMLVKKTAEQPETDRYAFSAKNGFVNKITGVDKVDKAIKKIAKSNGMNLDKCMSWAYSAIKYNSDTGRPTIPTTSKFKTARIKAEAKAAFASGKKAGDCYTYTTAAYCLAKYLGYDAKVVAGTYTSTQSGRVQPYSWAKIKLSGAYSIYDVTNNRFPIAPTDELAGYFAEL